MSPRDRGGAAGCQDMTNALVVLTQHFLHLLLYEWQQLSYIEMSGIDKYACDIDRTHFLHRHSQRQWHNWIYRLLLAAVRWKHWQHGSNAARKVTKKWGKLSKMQHIRKTVFFSPHNLPHVSSNCPHFSHSFPHFLWLSSLFPQIFINLSYNFPHFPHNFPHFPHNFP